MGAGAVLVAGCARTQPSEATPSPTPSSAGQGSAVGVEASATGALLGALLASAATTLGANASSQQVVDWQTGLASGALVAAPVWAATAWSLLSDDEEQSADLLGDLAGLLDPTASVLTPGATDGGLVWMASAASGMKSLDALATWPHAKSAALPAMAIERADGLGALNTIYGTNFAAVTQEDPAARAQLVVSGQAGIGAFRRTENTGGAALVELADPDKMCTPDPLVLLVNSAFADQQPELVLALNAVILALTNADVITLQRQIAQGGLVNEVARAWLVAKGLA
jgi:hypothetical protein